MTTTNLLIPLVEVNQSQKEVTVNEAIQLFENKLVEVAEVECEDGANTVPEQTTREAYCLNLVNGTSPPTAGFYVTLPAVKGPVVVRNLTGYTATLNVDGDGTQIALDATESGLFYVDGTTFAFILGGISTGATVFTALADAPSSYAGKAHWRVRVDADAAGLEFAPPQTVINEQTDDYALVLDDAENMVALNKATAVVLTVPKNADVAYPTGTQVHVIQLGAGQASIVGDTGVTVLTRSSLNLRDQYSVVRLTKLDSNLWAVDGSLAAAVSDGTFVALDDTPSSYSGEGGKLIAVKGNESGVEFVEAPYDIGTFVAGKPSASEIVLRFVAPRAFTLPAALTGSQVIAGDAATATTDFDVQKNGSTIGTVSFASSGSTATFTFASAVSFAAADVLSVIAPATPDATLADISMTFAGTRG